MPVIRVTAGKEGCQGNGRDCESQTGPGLRCRGPGRGCFAESVGRPAHEGQRCRLFGEPGRARARREGRCEPFWCRMMTWRVTPAVVVVLDAGGPCDCETTHDHRRVTIERGNSILSTGLAADGVRRLPGTQGPGAQVQPTVSGSDGMWVEFLLGRYCASTDEQEIEEGLTIVERPVGRSHGEDWRKRSCSRLGPATGVQSS